METKFKSGDKVQVIQTPNAPIGISPVCIVASNAFNESFEPIENMYIIYNPDRYCPPEVKTQILSGSKLQRYPEK